MTDRPDTFPAVSIVMPTYNMATFLPECISSILEQDYAHFELIVVDDGSTDQTKQLIRSFQDKRITYVQRAHDYMASMNAGIQMAQGKYILRMDADDVMLPGRITRQVEYMEKHPETDVCGSGMKNFGQDDSSSPGLAGHIAIASSLLLCNTMAHPTVIMRRESVKRYVERHGALYDKGYIYAEDYHLWTRMVMEGFRFDNLRDLLIKHRISPQAVTSAHAEESQKAGEKAKNEYLMYAIQEICKKGNAFEQLVDDMLKLADQHLLALQDVRQLVYVLYKRALQ